MGEKKGIDCSIKRNQTILGTLTMTYWRSETWMWQNGTFFFEEWSQLRIRKLIGQDGVRFLLELSYKGILRFRYGLSHRDLVQCVSFSLIIQFPLQTAIGKLGSKERSLLEERLAKAANGSMPAPRQLAPMPRPTVAPPSGSELEDWLYEDYEIDRGITNWFILIVPVEKFPSVVLCRLVSL